jgi:alpha-glucosidase (family GH31 glycosyl hydrolase)
MRFFRSTVWIFPALVMALRASDGWTEDLRSQSSIMQNTFDTSSPAVAPPWSMKPWLWEDDVNTSEAVWDLVDGCRDHDLPLGAVLIDSPWATRYNNFRFDEKRYPNPRGMIEALHKRDVRVVLWMTNVINTRDSLSDAPGDDEDLYAIGKAKGYFVNDGAPMSWWKGKGSMIDYTKPEAVAWWHRLLDRTLSLGVDGWKMDGSAEMFILTKRQTSRGVLSLRDYMDLYYRDTLHYCRTCQSDFVTMVRSVDIANSRGNDQPHAPFDAAPLTWVGDQRHSWTDKGLDEAIRSAFGALAHSYPSVSSDSGGYQTASKEPDKMPRLLYLRWAQWNALTPFFLIGGHDEHRPWKFDPEFFQIFRRYMWLHTELVPFFYSQHVQASLREGKLMHLAPGKHEFLLGDSLLVGVMADAAPRRQITFPDGVWLDYWDNRVEYRGGQTLDVAVPEDRSPVFVRLGSVIPLDVENDAVKHGSAASKGWRTLDIYPSAEPSDAAIWDTRAFPPSVARDRSFVSVKPSNTGLEIQLEGGPVRDTILRIWRSKAPASVAANGKVLDRRANAAAWEKDQQAWWFDAVDQRLWVRLAGVKDARVKIND